MGRRNGKECAKQKERRTWRSGGLELGARAAWSLSGDPGAPGAWSGAGSGAEADEAAPVCVEPGGSTWEWFREGRWDKDAWLTPSSITHRLCDRGQVA